MHTGTLTDAGAGRPRTAMVTARPGELVEHGNAAWRITKVIDLTNVIAENVDDGNTKVLNVKDLKGFEPAGARPPGPKRPAAIDGISHEDQETARRRLDVIRPLLDKGNRTRRDVAARAAEVGRHTATLYRWLALYDASGNLGDLIPGTRGTRPGTRRIRTEVEAIIEWAINESYLSADRPSAQDLIMTVRAACRKADVDSPSASTVRARIAEVPERLRLQRRGFRKRSNAKYQPTPGEFPDGDYPLACIQIDHTEVDLQIVDDEHRKPIGRPWVTVAIDVYSRVVTGFHLSLDAPSGTSVALCMAQAVMPKDALLLEHGIDAEWPVWGFPIKIHVDNAPEFRAGNLRKSCEFHGIDLEFRPVKRPEYGAHIERLISTFMTAVHGLPGTTYSSPTEKGDLDPEKRAVMTFSEAERWLLRYLCTVYHRRIHSMIGIPPIDKWRDGLLKDQGDLPAPGLPPRPVNGDEILLTFLPSFERIVQRAGVPIDGMRYFGEALIPWINAPDPVDRLRKRKLVFRRDPRDIAKVWFYDPEQQKYFEIPAADRRFPHTNVWELRQAKRELKQRGERLADPAQLIEALERLKSERNAASRKTKKARRQEQRHREHQRKLNKGDAEPPPESERLQDPADSADNLLDEPPEGYGLW